MTTTRAEVPPRRSPMIGYSAAAILARLADEMLGVSSVLLVLSRVGNPLLAGGIVSAVTLPSLVCGPMLGAFLDRTRYRRGTLAGGQLLISVAAFGLVATVGRVPSVATLWLAALAGIALPTTSGGLTSMVPSLVAPTALTKANAVDAAIFNLSALAGPAVAGGLSALAGPGWAMATVGCAAAASAPCIALLPANSRAPGRRAGPSLLGSVRAGLAHLVRTGPLRGATLASLVGFGSVGALAVAFPLFVRDLGVSAAHGGYLFAAIEFGALTGTLIVARHQDRWRPERTVFTCTALYGLVLLCLPIAPAFPVAMVIAACAGLVEGPTLAALFAARQRYTPADLLSQVSTTGASLKIGAFALGGVAGGALATHLGPGPLIALVALTQWLAAGLGAATSGTNRRR